MNRSLLVIGAIALQTLFSGESYSQDSSDSPAKTPTGSYLNNCNRFYPPSVADAGIQGVTVLSVRISPDGIAHDPQVVESSGNAALDDAAKSCVNGSRNRPITSRGVPIEVTNSLRVVWLRSFIGSAPAHGATNTCPGFYPPIDIRLGHQGITVLTFTIAVDGSVKNVALKSSSGHDTLDKAAMDCVAQFRYRPSIQDGKPVEIDGDTNIVWRIR